MLRQAARASLWLALSPVLKHTVCLCWAGGGASCRDLDLASVSVFSRKEPSCVFDIMRRKFHYFLRFHVPRYYAKFVSNFNQSAFNFQITVVVKTFFSG
ncbi:hypothetical protein Y1Q_0024375 [Alligator mississippiensis]|uniref:Secreted protein n=1 Tax=Alligator mississippiensis TaxID=8496 RepID=A0A151NJ49_ALLMI|nr:hypothetical protein Y1Q_0024375 [Alligator mississippiensis]